MTLEWQGRVQIRDNTWHVPNLSLAHSYSKNGNDDDDGDDFTYVDYGTSSEKATHRARPPSWTQNPGPFSALSTSWCLPSTDSEMAQLG